MITVPLRGCETVGKEGKAANRGKLAEGPRLKKRIRWKVSTETPTETETKRVVLSGTTAVKAGP